MYALCGTSRHTFTLLETKVPVAPYNRSSLRTTDYLDLDFVPLKTRPVVVDGVVSLGRGCAHRYGVYAFIRRS